MKLRVITLFTVAFILCAPLCCAQPSASDPRPPGTLVDLGGQRLHLNCTGKGSPTVLLENGTGDISVIWSLVQPRVSSFTRVCSYDRGGYAWSDPGTRPRTFAQLALELHTALEKSNIHGPYVLVGQSYGGFVVRGFAERYRQEVVGMVLVDSVHEDQQIVYGGQPHRLRDQAKGLPFLPPHIGLDEELIRQARTMPSPGDQPLEFPLTLMPSDAQSIWLWANKNPVLELAQQYERDWSVEELQRFHNQRLKNRSSLGALPLIVLARTNGGFGSGMSVSAEDLEKERRDLQNDLARLSTRGKLVFARHAGHNIHLEDPELVIGAIKEVVSTVRTRR